MTKPAQSKKPTAHLPELKVQAIHLLRPQSSPPLPVNERPEPTGNQPAEDHKKELDSQFAPDGEPQEVKVIVGHARQSEDELDLNESAGEEGKQGKHGKGMRFSKREKKGKK